MRRSQWRIKAKSNPSGWIYTVQVKCFGFLWVGIGRTFFTEWGARNWIEWAESYPKVKYIDVN